MLHRKKREREKRAESPLFFVFKASRLRGWRDEDNGLEVGESKSAVVYLVDDSLKLTAANVGAAVGAASAMAVGIDDLFGVGGRESPMISVLGETKATGNVYRRGLGATEISTEKGGRVPVVERKENDVGRGEGMNVVVGFVHRESVTDKKGKSNKDALDLTFKGFEEKRYIAEGGND